MIELKDEYQTKQKLYVDPRRIIVVDTANVVDDPEPEFRKFKFRLRIIVDTVSKIGEYVLLYKTEKKRDEALETLINELQ